MDKGDLVIIADPPPKKYGIFIEWDEERYWDGHRTERHTVCKVLVGGVEETVSPWAVSQVIEKNQKNKREDK